MKKITLQCVHQVAGRLRLKTDRRSFDAHAVQGVKQTLLAIAGIRSVQYRAATGSVVIDYDPRRLVAGDIFSALETLGYIIQTAQPARPATVANEGSIGQKVMDLALQTAVEKLLEKSTLALIAALI